MNEKLAGSCERLQKVVVASIPAETEKGAQASQFLLNGLV